MKSSAILYYICKRCGKLVKRETIKSPVIRGTTGFSMPCKSCRDEILFNPLNSKKEFKE